MLAPTNRLLAALPVSVQEFRESLASIWLPRVRVRRPRLGLAISGGVDSMALATLSADLSQEINEDDDTDVFTAFIVDHQLRKGSSEEALAVRENLYKLGIESEILQMQWPTGTDTQSLTNLETRARRLRFRLLGQACRDHGIESLLLAHHSDDQAETVLMRLVEGHKGTGLRGMKTVNDIPECFGIHGVHQSYAEWVTNDAPLESTEQRAVKIEHWGIQVLRPLLPFSKERLVATCQASGTQWVEDETNKDPTLTMRNAIRHTYEKRTLPAALSKPALLQLSQRMNDKVQRREREVDALLYALETVLDVRSGELVIRFPRTFFPPNIPIGGGPLGRFSRPNVNRFDLEDGKIIAAMLLRRLTLLVSPKETVALSSLETAVRRLFPRLYISSPLGDFTDSVPASFTAGGVLFKRIETPSDYFPYYAWTLSRQPYARSELPTLRIPPMPTSAFSGDQIYTSLSPQPSDTDYDPSFELFDGRFWLRVYNPSDQPLTIRPFRKTDLRPFRDSLDGVMRERFEALLIDSAKSQARFTLPVIAAPNPDDEGADYVVAMPTFGVKINAGEATAAWEDLKWDVRYKKMDTSALVRDTWDDYPAAVRRQVEKGERGWSEDDHVPFVHE